MSKKRILPTAIFIACEGRSTEKNYFQMIGELFGDELNYVLTVYPDENEAKPKSTPLGLITEAINRNDEGFDELWAVFDKDGYTKHEDAFESAKENNVRIAFSSIAFEEWVLLHFGRFFRPFSKSDCKNEDKKYIECGSHKQPGDCLGANCVAGYMREHNLFSDYTKSSNKSIFPFLRNKTNNAIKNAAWLRYKIRNELQRIEGKIFELNPYTDVDLLVKRLTGYNKNHFYYQVDDMMDAELFNAQVHIPQSKYVVLDITPKEGSNGVVNKVNLNDWFTIRDDEKSYSIDIDRTYLIQPNKRLVINLCVSEELSKSVEVTMKWGTNDFYHILRQ